MLTFGLIVEGVYDVAALTEFIQKCTGDHIEVVPHPCGSKSTLMKKLPLFLERFRHAKAGAPVDKALVIHDADNQNANALIRQMRDSYHNREHSPPDTFLKSKLIYGKQQESISLRSKSAQEAATRAGIN